MENSVLPLLKIGYLIPGCIVKSLPNHESYLILVSGTETLAFLPKKYANRGYKVGDELVAAVFIMDKNRIILNQRSGQYYLRIAELIFEPLLKEHKIKVKRAASVETGGFVKIAVESLNGINPVKECIPYLKQAKMYTGDTITLVRYSTEMSEYIRNSLAPAPAEKIEKVIYTRYNREATVRVDPKYYGLFVGKRGANVSTAAKLLDISIIIKKHQLETPLDMRSDNQD